MLVYRLENEEGFGPYYHKSRLECIELVEELTGHNSDPTRPGAFEDDLLDKLYELRNKYGKNVLFGFESLDKLKRWFVDWVLKDLKEHGYRVKVYNVLDEDTKTTNYQTIFTNGELYYEYIN